MWTPAGLCSLSAFPQGTEAVPAVALSSWSQVAQLLPGDGPDEHSAHFGSSAASHGDTLAVAAPWDYPGPGGAIYVFVRSGAAFTLQARISVPTPGGGDGYALALSQDSLVVGLPGANNYKGVAQVYVRDSGSWSWQADLSPPDLADYDGFGQGVAIDGDTAVVGGSYVDGAAFNTGGAYVFARSGTTWTQEAKLQAADGVEEDYFGSATAVLGDVALVGAPAGMTGRIGAVYVYERDGASWTERGKLSASDVTAWDEFGRVLALSSDTLAVAAPYNEPGGAVYVFTRDGSSWSGPQKLAALGAVALGYSLALSGDTLVASTHSSSGYPLPSGSASVFARNGATWRAAGRLAALGGPGGDSFGSSVAIMGGSVVVGASWDDTPLGVCPSN